MEVLGNRIIRGFNSRGYGSNLSVSSRYVVKREDVRASWRLEFGELSRAAIGT
jgi:hypothetical protein